MSRKFLTVAMATALVAGSFTPAVAHAFSSGSSASSAIMEDPNAPGTRNNPHTLGTTVRDGGWEVTINEVDLSADHRVLEANMFNSPAPEGHVYVLVNATLKYVGKSSEGDSTFWSTINFVTHDGVTVTESDHHAVAPDALNSFTTLYTGGKVTGNVVFAVPKENLTQGTIVVQPDLWSKKFFYKVS